jgi:16S rRNA (guanine966-N2)-methyltransferase
MRIISGRNRGLTLTPVGAGDSKAHLRPTSDRVRESIFNVLENGGYDDPIAGARVLDIFAGTGALGLEALSRGAAFATFVDSGNKSAQLVTKNIELTRNHENAKLIKREISRLGANPDRPYSLVFVDPPYGQGMAAPALKQALSNGWIDENAIIIVEENALEFFDGFDRLDDRKYGDTFVQFLAVSRS